MDRLIVERKLDSLHRCIERVTSRRPASVEALEADVDLQDVLVLNLSRAVQSPCMRTTPLTGTSSTPSPPTACRISRPSPAPSQTGSMLTRNAVDAGEYAPTSEAIREAVREWKERRDLLGYTVNELRALAQAGLDSGTSSRTMADIKTEARRRLADAGHN